MVFSRCLRVTSFPLFFSMCLQTRWNQILERTVSKIVIYSDRQNSNAWFISLDAVMITKAWWKRTLVGEATLECCTWRWRKKMMMPVTFFSLLKGSHGYLLLKRWVKFVRRAGCWSEPFVGRIFGHWPFESHFVRQKERCVCQLSKLSWHARVWREHERTWIMETSNCSPLLSENTLPPAFLLRLYVNMLPFLSNLPKPKKSQEVKK